MAACFVDRSGVKGEVPNRNNQQPSPPETSFHLEKMSRSTSDSLICHKVASSKCHELIERPDESTAIVVATDEPVGTVCCCCGQPAHGRHARNLELVFHVIRNLSFNWLPPFCSHLHLLLFLPFHIPPLSFVQRFRRRLHGSRPVFVSYRLTNSPPFVPPNRMNSTAARRLRWQHGAPACCTSAQVQTSECVSPSINL